MNEGDHAAARRVLAGLARGAERDLLHVLTCASCWIDVTGTLQAPAAKGSVRRLGGARKKDLMRLLRAFREGDAPQARTWYAKATASAEAAGDVECTAYLERCSVLVHPAPEALTRVRRALSLARTHGLAGEALRCEANLGLVHLELGNWGEAQSHLSACQASVGGAALGAVLNNLGLAVASEVHGQAVRHLSTSLATAGRSYSPAILSNLAALLLGDEPKEAPRLDHLAVMAAERCDAPLLDCVVFNQARSLVDEGELPQALDLVESRDVAPEERRDGALVAGRWARLREEILKRLGLPVPSAVQQAAEALQRSTEPQAWLYRKRWALCPIPLYDALPWTVD